MQRDIQSSLWANGVALGKHTRKQGDRTYFARRSSTLVTSFSVTSEAARRTRRWYRRSAASSLKRSRLPATASMTSSTDSSPTFWAILFTPSEKSLEVYESSRGFCFLL